MGNESSIFFINLEVRFPGEAAIEDTSNWVIVDLKNMGEFQDERADFVLLEVEATSEGVQARDGYGLLGLGEKEVLQFEDFAKLLLDFHVVVKTMIANALELLRNGGGLRHCPRGRWGEGLEEKRRRFDEADG